MLSIRKNPKLSIAYFGLITSIPGIGLQIAANIIAYTQAFHLFDCPRKFACYSGIAPFPYQSGSSIKGRTRVSHFVGSPFLVQVKSRLF
jgi:transposase